MKKIIFSLAILTSICFGQALDLNAISSSSNVSTDLTDKDWRVLEDWFFQKWMCVANEIKPACWENGFTYSNRCSLEENWAKFKNYWQCEPISCKSWNEYVCGLDGASKTNMSYRNWCYAEANKATNIKLGLCEQKNENWDLWNWKTDSLAWGKQNWLTAYSTWKDFNPDGILTREQAAKMIDSYMNYNGFYISDSNSACNFSDYNTIDPTLKTFVTLQCKKGIIKGANWKFYPKNTLTTAQALTMVMRATWVKTTNPNIWWLDYEKFARSSQYLSATFDLNINDSTPITRQQFLYLLAKTSQYIWFQSILAESANIFPFVWW